MEKFKKLLEKNSRTTRFVIVTGGGSVARKYIQALKEEGKGEKELSRAGIRVTRLNALFLMQFFGKEANDSLPFDIVKDRQVKECSNDGVCLIIENLNEFDEISITKGSGSFTSIRIEEDVFGKSNGWR